MAEMSVDVRNHARKVLEEAAPNVLVVKRREAGHAVYVAVVIARAVTRDTKLTVLVCDVITSEDGAGWMASCEVSLPSPFAGVKLIISDKH